MAKYNLNIDDFSSRYEEYNEEEDEEDDQNNVTNEEYKENNKETFSKHLESSSQGDMKIEEVNYEQEFSEKEEIKETDNELNTQGQINGYWKQENVEDFNHKNSSEKFNDTFDNTNGFNNFEKLESEKKKQKQKSRFKKKKNNNKKKRKVSRSSSSSSSGSSSNSSSDSSSSQSSDSD